MSHQHQHRDIALHVYVCLLLLTSCTYTVMYGPQPMFNTLCADLGIGRGEVGLTISVFMLTLSISPLWVGLLLGKIGIKRALVCSSLLLGLSAVAFFWINSFSALMLVRLWQGILTPILLTTAMSCIVYVCRHFDLRRALAGYITATLVGSLTGRLLGGIGADLIGWRWTLFLFALPIFSCAFFLRNITESKHKESRAHSIREYKMVLKQHGVAPLLFMEACGIFSFAAIGNLIPLRMAEINPQVSEGLIGCIYIGYSIGLIASLTIKPLRRIFGTTAKLLIFGTLLYALSLFSLFPNSTWALFGGLWFIAFGEFIVHSLAPGQINLLATKSGHCDTAMVNGLFLSIYYCGGVLGSWLPGLFYAHFGWNSALGLMLCVQFTSLLVAIWLKKNVKEID